MKPHKRERRERKPDTVKLDTMACSRFLFVILIAYFMQSVVPYNQYFSQSTIDWLDFLGLRHEFKFCARLCKWLAEKKRGRNKIFYYKLRRYNSTSFLESPITRLVSMFIMPLKPWTTSILVTLKTNYYTLLRIAQVQIANCVGYYKLRTGRFLQFV